MHHRSLRLRVDRSANTARNANLLLGPAPIPFHRAPRPTSRIVPPGPTVAPAPTPASAHTNIPPALAAAPGAARRAAVARGALLAAARRR